MFFLVERRDGSPIVVAGPCWPFCTFVTVPLIVVLSGLVGYFIVSNPATGLVSAKAAGVCRSAMFHLMTSLLVLTRSAMATSWGRIIAMVVCADILSNCGLRIIGTILREL